MAFYQLVAWMGCLLESRDAASTLFDTRGVRELATALGVPPGAALMGLRAWCGMTDAPWIFWKDADQKIFDKAEGSNITSDPCSWIVVEDGKTCRCGRQPGR